MRRLVNGAGLPFDEVDARNRAARAVDRSWRPEGALRQLIAVGAAPDRTAALGRLDMPSLVIHGEADPLVPVANGRQTAAALPGSRLMLIPDMGHHLPERLWEQVIDAIVEVAARADPRVSAQPRLQPSPAPAP